MYTRSRVSACAGHPGETDVGNFVLQPVAARKLSIPFVTSGGVGDGKQLAASLALGAEGVNLGTRFMATLEAPIHANIKQALVDGDENSTQLVMRTLRNTERVYKNRTSDEVLRIEAEHPGEIDKIIHLVRGDVCAATRPTHAAPRTHTARGPALYPKPRASTMLRLPIFRHRAGRTTAQASRKQGTSTPAYGHVGQSWALLMMSHRVRPSCRAWWTRPRPLSRDGSWRCAKMTEWSNSSAYTELLAPQRKD
jgi:NAD(P)H-dependent flavin oxidoreductase YrpB (nitropropane dioxygenase family)